MTMVMMVMMVVMMLMISLTMTAVCNNASLSMKSKNEASTRTAALPSALAALTALDHKPSPHLVGPPACHGHTNACEQAPNSFGSR